MSFLDRLHSAIVKGAPAFTALKSVPFGETGASTSPLVIYPNMNAWQDAIGRALSSSQSPSDDPHLSSLVAAGYTWLGSTLPEPDLQVKKEFQRKQGGKSRDDDVIEKHPIYELFKNPNPYTTDTELWQAFAYSWIIDGNVYWQKFRNDFGQVVEIWPEPHFNIQARWINDRNGEYIPAERSLSVPSVPRNDRLGQFINYYEIIRDGVRFRIEPADVVHFKNGQNPFSRRYGRSPLVTMLREIYGDSAMANYAANLLGGGGVIPCVLGVEDKEGLLSQEDLQNVKDKLIEQTSGTSAGAPLVLSSRMTFARTGLTPQELDLRVSRYMAEEVFSRCTGIPSIVMNLGSGMERTIWNNMKEADRRAVDQYLQPLWWQIAKTIRKHLLLDFDQDQSHFIEFDLSEVGALQEDQNELWKRLDLAYEGGWLKRSEARMEAGYEVDPDGGDDVYKYKTGVEIKTLDQEAEARMNPEPPQIPGQPLQIGAGQQQKLLTGANPIIKELFTAE